MNYQIEGVILKSFKSGEFDRVYWVFSRDRGKISFVAKGVRKPLAKLAGGLEPLTQAEFFLIKGKKIDRIVGTIIFHQFKNIRNNLEKNLRARSVLDLISYLEMESTEAGKIYFQLESFLFELNKNNLSQEKVDLLSLGVVWKIIFLSGWALDFYHCSFCGKKLEKEGFNYFCFCKGIGCAECLKKEKVFFQKMKISQEIIKILRFFIQQDLTIFKKLKISKLLIFSLKKLTKAYLDEIIEKKMLDLWF